MNTRSSIIFRYHGIEAIAKCFLMGSLAKRGIKLHAKILKDRKFLSNFGNFHQLEMSLESIISKHF